MRHLKTLAATLLTAMVSTVSTAQESRDVLSTWEGIDYDGNPWVVNVSESWKPTK